MRNKGIRTVALILMLVMLMGFASMSFASYPTPEQMGADVINSLKDAGKTIVDGVINTASKLISQIFSDIRESDWYATTVKKLVDMGGINGYPDGTFKPNNQITRAEFTKILVSALGYDNLKPTGSHWASGYVDKAVSIGLATSGELSDLNRAITRKEMAKMVANALDHRGESHVDNRANYRTLVTDYNNISKSYQDYVLKAFTKGIITGYPDGTFGPERGLTRAEASTVIIRVLDKNERKVPELPKPPTNSGINVDLNTVPITSEIRADIFKPGENIHDVDFSLLIRMWEPLEPQHNDIENILRARFGNAKEVSEIMNYIKEKKVRADELESKWWTVNGQRMIVESNPNSQNASITCWYPK